ncbi:MAG: FkbM family methyltransferase [Flavobacteriales bacterium]|jgi:FkbM family methyltransferase|nr:MAG: FkbM family methyltransferase [Flavobacteriales bacterium]
MKQLIRRLVYGPPPEEDRLVAEATRFPRHMPTTIGFRDLHIRVTDMLSVAWQIKEFFGDERMKLRCGRPDPVVIDCGTNVGVSVLYLKKLFPAARITCFEPDPAVFACLEDNLRSNGITDVVCRREVVWVDDQGVSFGSEGADGGSILRTDNAVVLPSVRLRDVLEQHADIDLLKVDIEGAETTVLNDCGDALRRVRNLYVEYHSMPDRPQELHALLATLAANGFRYYIHRIGVYHRHPFAGLQEAAMDMQLDIHAIRS